jgi:5'-nucleotidase
MIYFKEELIKKAEKFNNDNAHVVTDFDLTLTAPQSDSSWSVFSKSGVLGSAFIDEADALVKYYHALELDETLDFEQKFAYMDEWWHKEFSLFIKYGLTKKLLEEALDKAPVFFRDGAKEFLIAMHKNNIPVIIISGGIGNIIEKVLKRNKCNFDNIHMLANFIEFNGGIATKLKGKMIHVLNKNEQALPPRIHQSLETRPNVILLGDMVGDASMTSVPTENVIRVGFLNQREKEKENLEPFQKAFDVVCTDNTSFTELFEKIGIF